MRVQPLAWSLDPCEVIERWPLTMPLAALISRGGGAHARWSIFGLPRAWSEVARSEKDADDQQRAWRRLVSPGHRSTAPMHDEPSLLPPSAPASGEPTALPFERGWIGFLCYELAQLIEPTSLTRGRLLPGWPLAGGWTCDAALIHDAHSGQWWHSGPASRLPVLEARREHALIHSMRADQAEGTFAAQVSRVRDAILNGDLFQANIAQRWSGKLTGSPRALAVAALEASQARYGAIIERPDGAAVISMSPELFLEVDRCGGVVTRPIKGTLPRERDPSELRRSEKDAAELAMIVDLMRNDLSRVCRPGSVRVVSAREIETHPALHHAVAEVRGRLRHRVGVPELLWATFPPGSVTGAPKVAAMRLIDALEGAPRGPYCGAVGCVADHGTAVFNVAIRTIVLDAPESDGTCTFRYSAGCGIVSDSDPAREEAESELKRAVLDRTAQALSSAAGSTVTPHEAVAASAARQ
ncbi:MAG: anthranilate synthase component I family protein [Phycisphaeraceae bacterium]|nr:anthranilate synthase component I family protein [Phycisphaeraceae bacterium]